MVINQKWKEIVAVNKNIAEKIIHQRIHGIKGDAWTRYANDNDWYYNKTTWESYFRYVLCSH